MLNNGKYLSMLHLADTHLEVKINYDAKELLAMNTPKDI